MKYRKKPIVIEAVQFTGDQKEIIAFTGDANIFTPIGLIIHTLEGDHRAKIGDWIIKGIQGEFYPCKSDIFEQTYEEVK